MNNNLIIHQLVNFFNYLLQTIFPFFLPSFLQNKPDNIPLSPCCIKPKIVEVVHLPLETFAEIMEFASIEDLNQIMVFVSRNFALLAFPILRRRFTVRISAWTKDFVDPIYNEDYNYINKILKRVPFCLESAEIVNAEKPFLTGYIVVAPIFGKYSKIRKNTIANGRLSWRTLLPTSIIDHFVILKNNISIEWRANGGIEWERQNETFSALEGNIINFMVKNLPVHYAEGAKLEFRFNYHGRPLGLGYKPEDYGPAIRDICYTFTAKTESNQQNNFCGIFKVISFVFSIIFFILWFNFMR